MLPTQDLTEKTKKEGYVHAERVVCINPFSIIAAYVSVTAVPCSCARKAMTTGQELFAVSQRGYLLVRKKADCVPICRMCCILHVLSGGWLQNRPRRVNHATRVVYVCLTCGPVFVWRASRCASAAVCVPTRVTSQGSFEGTMGPQPSARGRRLPRS